MILPNEAFSSISLKIFYDLDIQQTVEVFDENHDPAVQTAYARLQPFFPVRPVCQFIVNSEP